MPARVVPLSIWGALYDVLYRGAAKSGTLKKVVGSALVGHAGSNQCSLTHARKDIAYYQRMCERMDERPSELAQAAYDILDWAVSDELGDEHVSALLKADVLPRRAS